MRLYSAADEQALHSRHLLKEWTSEGFLTDAQYQRFDPETVSDLRSTNLFLRLVLFFFTLIGVGAAVGLFFMIFAPSPSSEASGAVLLMFAVASYAAAEIAVAQARLYRYGIEEALAAGSVGLLCGGLASTFGLYGHHTHFVVPAAGAIVSLWIWHRFGLWYAFLAALIFINVLAADWTSSHMTQLLLAAGFYAIGLVCVAAIRIRRRSDPAEPTYSVAEALLWVGIYLTLNLKISVWNLPAYWWGGEPQNSLHFPMPFYWATWVLIWCLPPVILAGGIRLKDRFVLAAGIAAALSTLLTNKPYLGWPRHSWDPMLLGIVLVGAVLYLRRWLSRGTGGIRNGFTAARLSKRHDGWMNAGSAALGLITPQSISPGAQAIDHRPQSAGGASGGAGASRNF